MRLSGPSRSFIWRLFTTSSIILSPRSLGSEAAVSVTAELEPLLRADSSRLVECHDLGHAIKGEHLFAHFLRFRRIVGHEFHRDRAVIEDGFEEDHCGSYHDDEVTIQRQRHYWR